MTDAISPHQQQRVIEAVQQEQLRRACARSFASFLAHWSFVNRETGDVLTFAQLWPGQVAFVRLMEQERFILALKAGKLGFTELECAYDAWVALFATPNARVHLFSRDDRASQELLSYVKFGLSHLPRWMRPEPLQSEPGGDTARSLKFRLGPEDTRTIVSYAAGAHVSVDQSCQHAHVDELAKMPFAEKTWSAIYSTIAPGGSCHVVTRGAGDDNVVATLWKAAEAGTSEFAPFFQPWTARPDRDRAWYELQEGVLTLQALRHFAPDKPDDALSADEAVEFIPVELWDRCREDLPPLLPGSKEYIVLGIDASVTGDFTAIVAVSRHPRRHDDVAVRGIKLWIPPRGGQIDFSEVEQFIREACAGRCAQGHVRRRSDCSACRINDRTSAGSVVGVVYDPYQLAALIQTLNREGIAPFREFNQGNHRLLADSQLRHLILRQRIAHNGDERLREHIMNAVVELDLKDESKLRIRKKAQDRKVDLLVALSMATHECLRLTI